MVRAAVRWPSRSRESKTHAMPRFFTLAEAERLLPDLDRAVREAIGLKEEATGLQSRLEATLRRLSMLGGAIVDTGPIATEKTRLRDAVNHLRRQLEEITSLGCLVKDLELGLVDFPTNYRGREVYLCWRLGERSIQFWHGVDEGFPGRKQIDEHFLSNHRGSGTN